MQIQTQPLNPESRSQLQRWLSGGEHHTLRNLIRCRIAIAKAKIVEKTVEAVGDEQYAKDAMDAAREVVFYERVLHLLASMQLGHNPDKPSEGFEYALLELITDQEPIITQANG